MQSGKLSCSFGSRKISLNIFERKESVVNAIRVPIPPNNEIYLKLEKNSFFFKVYPAARMIGGRRIVKNTSGSN